MILDRSPPPIIGVVDAEFGALGCAFELATVRKKGVLEVRFSLFDGPPKHVRLGGKEMRRT